MTVPFTEVDAKYGLPAGTLASVWQQESGCGKNTGPSHNAKGECIGAMGHFQFMQGTRNDILAKTGYDAYSKNPEEAAQAAGFLLRSLESRFGGNLSMALAAYNTGAGNVKSAVAKAKAVGGDWLSHLSAETRNYVPGILGRIGTKIDYTMSNVSVDTGRFAAYDQRRRQGLTTKDQDDAEIADREGALYALGADDAQIAKMSRNDMFGAAFMGIFFKLLNLLMPSSPTMPSPAPGSVSPMTIARETPPHTQTGLPQVTGSRVAGAVLA